MDVTVVTGMSGSGKSTAINALEDQGYYCIDNLPTTLVPRFVGVCAEAGEGMSRVALVIDLRNISDVSTWFEVRNDLEEQGHRVCVLYLDTSDDVLLRRFSETRRPHPLGTSYDLPEAIKTERTALNVLRESADVVIDTSAYNVHQLKARIVDTISASTSGQRPALTVRSFGYKYGTATDADLIFDTRFIPNPYFIDALRPLSGLDDQVANYVLDRDESVAFLDHVMGLLRFLLPKYAAEGKAYLTVAMGCTGGRHRSVVLAAELAKRLTDEGFTVSVRHRDIDRDSS